MSSKNFILITKMIVRIMKSELKFNNILGKWRLFSKIILIYLF